MIENSKRPAARYPDLAHRGCAATLSRKPVIEERQTERNFAKRDFTLAIEPHIDALYGLAMRLARNEADAEDLVAETVTKAWQAFDTLDDPDRLRPWVFRILRNHFISEYRKKRARPRLVSIDDQDDDSSDGSVISILDRQTDDFLQWWANPETEVANRLLGEQIMAAIDELPESFREAIMLVNVDGLRYDEAAAVLGVPPGTIRSRMKRGRTLLQKALWVQAKDAGLIPGRENAT
jgi:RNA polymerase sigma-70 factor (ECF subfamily)